jgi:hypothetical protein
MSHHGMTGWGPAMIVMVLALALWNKERPIRVHPALLWLGDISFSLYLVHRIPQLALRRYIPHGHASLAGGGGYVLFTIVASLILARFSYRYLERGLSERVRRALLARLR